MTTRGWFVILVICVFFSGLIGYLMRGSSEQLNKSMAWGFEEKKNVWNRIRVNESGFIICAKE